MTGQVRRRAADRRKAELERRQVPITEERLDRFVGRSLSLLVEEAVEGEELCLARGTPHAPEVDGLVVLRGRGFRPGGLVRARIIRRNGIDLEAVPSAGDAPNRDRVPPGGRAVRR
jgi:ribosomal protein S12 methylthiotransferase